MFQFNPIVSLGEIDRYCQAEICDHKCKACHDMKEVRFNTIDIPLADWKLVLDKDQRHIYLNKIVKQKCWHCSMNE